MSLQNESDRARQSGRKTLSEVESKTILKTYGIPVVDETVVRTQEECVLAAAKLGFPVVVKAVGGKLAHKTERGLVKTHLDSEEEVRRACEP